MNLELKLEDFQEHLADASFQGELTAKLTGLASLSEAKPGDVAFLSNNKYKGQVPGTKASAALLPNDYEGSPSAGQLYIRVDNPSATLSALCQHIEQTLWPKPKAGVHGTAVVDGTARIASTAYVGPFCQVEAGAVVGEGSVLTSSVYVGRGVQVGSGCWLMPQVRVLDFCSLGNRVRVHSGVVIGSDGFGYLNLEGKHTKIPQVGKVVIEDDVEIGANTTIDRARFAETRIGQGTKIDNLVQIAHNVQIGKHCLILSQAGIAGSTVVEDNVVVGGQVGIVDHVRIGQGSMIGSQSGINCNLSVGSVVRGSPARPVILEQRLEVLKKRLPELFQRVSHLEERNEHKPNR